MLTLHIEFPTGSYGAARHEAEREPEWPPHPSRVFSALVAAAYRGSAQLPATERAALLTVESMDPPRIWAPPADLRAAPDTYVPVNDMRSRMLSHPAAPNRQRRQFPKAYLLGEPRVTYGWDVQTGSETVAALTAVAARITHVGRSESLATAWLADHAPEHEPSFVPDEDGDLFLRTPRSGRLAELESIEALRLSTRLRRPLSSLFERAVPYRRLSSSNAPRAVDTGYDVAVVRLEGVAWEASAAHRLAEALRRAVMGRIGDPLPPVVHGHDAAIRHIAWLPLPDVAHAHASQRILGALIALPREIRETDRVRIAQALLGTWALRLPGGQQATLTLLTAGALSPAGLRADTWIGPASDWATVTPVLLDRPPRKVTTAGTLRAVAQSLAHAGMPPPSAIRLLRSSAFDGGPAIREVPDPRPKVHVALRFSAPVRGPVLAGRLRNFGIGLFRPLRAGEFDEL